MSEMKNDCNATMRLPLFKRRRQYALSSLLGTYIHNIYITEYNNSTIQQQQQQQQQYTMTQPNKIICVFCGSSFGNTPQYATGAAKLGELMASQNYGLVYGGGTTGLMGAIAKSVASRGVYVHGIIPDALVSKERKSTTEIEEMNKEIQESVENHKGETPLDDSYGKSTIVKDMHTRKKMMGQEADAFVAMPGGFGTLEELFEITTWSQLGIHSKPIILFNLDGFYDELMNFVEKCIANGFISENNGKILQVANTAEEVIEKLNNYTVPEGRFNLSWSNQ